MVKATTSGLEICLLELAVSHCGLEDTHVLLAY